MSLDAYSPCPCGSGKKLKFCCLPIASEMEKVERYQQGNQPRLALQALDAIQRKHPGNAWGVTSRAEILLQDRRADEATEVLEPLIREQPDHKYAVGLMALASFAADGYELAKPAIHRAFQRSSRDFPTLTANLAIAIAGTMLQSSRYLSARAHLALALRMAPDDNKAGVFRRLMEFDGNRRIPYPLRSVHEMVDFSPADDKRDDARKAFVLSNIGCWRPAAKLLTKLAEAQPDNAELWYDIGLCRAWDGDEKLAAEALRKASRLHGDRETAVEWETLAQLLEENVTEDRLRIMTRQFGVTSTSSLIAVLEDDTLLSRVEFDPDDEEPPAALYFAVDRPKLAYPFPEPPTIETAPRIVAQVTLFDADEDQPQRVIITGTEGEEFDAALKRFDERAGDLVSPSDPESEDEDSTFGTIPREISWMMWRLELPSQTPLGIRRRLEADMWRHVTTKVWPDTPFAALGGQTPRQAAGDPSLAVALRGAVNVLDAQCDRGRYALPIVDVYRDLGIDPPPPATFDRESSATSLRVLRVPFQELDDDKLGLLLQRAVLNCHGRHLYDVLREVLNRPGCLDRFDNERLFATIADLSREQMRNDEALQWIARGRDVAKNGDHAFQRTLTWVVHELSVRLGDPSDPEIASLLQHISDYYLPKIPELRDEIDEMLESCNVIPPWADDKPRTRGESNAGLWTPDDEPAVPVAAGKKLWMPGQ